MPRTLAYAVIAIAVLAGAARQTASAADADPCTHFKWDVSRELAVMKETPQAVTAAVKPEADIPQVRIGKLYSLKLSDQGAVTFAADPAKETAARDARAGLVRFRVAKRGRYRVSITSGHWVDVVDRTRLVKSVDYQGHVGCERPRKIVEYELPAGAEFTLQLSGASDAEVLLAITAVRVAAN